MKVASGPMRKATSAPMRRSERAMSVSTTSSGVAASPGPYFGRSRYPNAPTAERMRRISGWKMTTVETAM